MCENGPASGQANSWSLYFADLEQVASRPLFLTFTITPAPTFDVAIVVVPVLALTRRPQPRLRSHLPRQVSLLLQHVTLVRAAAAAATTMALATATATSATMADGAAAPPLVQEVAVGEGHSAQYGDALGVRVLGWQLPHALRRSTAPLGEQASPNLSPSPKPNPSPSPS